MADEKFNDELLREVKQITEKQREYAEKYGVESAEYKRYVENSDARMAEFDKKNEELTHKIEEKVAGRKQIEDEIKGRIEHLETLVSASKNAPVDQKDALVKATQYMEAELVSGSMKSIADIDCNQETAEKYNQIITEYKAANNLVRTDINEVGGFLVPEIWSDELMRQIIEVSPVRQVARVRTMDSKTIHQPIRQGVPTALFEGETEESTNSVSNYTSEQITHHSLTYNHAVTWDSIMDSGYNITEEIMQDAMIAFSQAEGRAFVRGSGAKGPYGFVNDDNVPLVDTATNTLTFDDIINLAGELKSGYNPMYAFNRRTLAYLRTLKDQNDRYLWNGPFGDAASGTPATINGIRYTSGMIDMDDYDVNEGIPVVLADWFRFYCIYDRRGMRIIRDELTRKKERIVELSLSKWIAGKVIIKEAGVRLKKIT